MLYLFIKKFKIMKKLVFIMAAIVFGTTSVYTQEMSKAEVFDLLVMWQGKWKNTATFEKSEWTPKSFKRHGITESNLILSNNYLEIVVYSGDSITKHLICYDQVSKKFNRWEFKNDGSNNFWVGKWDKDNKKMTWDFIDFSGSGINGKIIEKFESKGIIKTQVIMKDNSDKSLLLINSLKQKI